jgi:hypothetical protein
MKKITSILFILSLCITFFGCKKSNDIDAHAPEIEIESPIQNSIYPALTGDCHMEFTATDDVELEGIAVNITNAAGANLYINNLTVHTKSHDYHDHLVTPNITSITSCTLKIVVTDKVGNATTKTVAFNLKP